MIPPWSFYQCRNGSGERARVKCCVGRPMHHQAVGGAGRHLATRENGEARLVRIFTACVYAANPLRATAASRDAAFASGARKIYPGERGRPPLSRAQDWTEN